MKFRFILPISVLVLSGCSTYSKRQCREMDWYREGQAAALDGFTLKQGKTRFIDKCQEDQGIPMDGVAFERGFNNGLATVCSSENMQGKEICQKDDEAQAVVNPTREQILNNRVKQLEAEIAKLEGKIDELEGKLTSCKIGSPE